MPRTVSPREIVEAYVFWKWEYDRRNTEYINAYGKLIEKAAIIIRKSQPTHKRVIPAKTRLQQILKDMVDDVLPIMRPWDPLYIYEIQNKRMKRDIKDFSKTYGRRPRDPKHGYSAKDIVKFLIEDRKKPESERSKDPGEDIRGKRPEDEEMQKTIHDALELYAKHLRDRKPLNLPKDSAEEREKSHPEYSEYTEEDIGRQGEVSTKTLLFLNEYMDLEHGSLIQPAGVEIVKWDKLRKKFRVEIDMTKPLTEILEGISTFYLNLNFYEKMDRTNLLPLLKHHFGIINKFLNENELRRLRSWAPRAAGLLLWESGTTAEDALKDPEVRKNLENLGYNKPFIAARQAEYVKPGLKAKKTQKEDYYRQFRGYREVTEACIDQREVLPVKWPISVDGREKLQNK